MNGDTITSASAIIGGGFVGGLLLGYALKKIVKIVAVVVGLFMAALAYLQYQQIAYFDWNRIEGLFTSVLGNVTSQISSSQNTSAFASFDFGIPLTSSMSAGFAIGFMRG
ncbi:MAG: FUN14 domain-containing protein [Nitrososphaeraceae archaeon]